MSAIAAVTAIMGALLIGVMSPGPSFVLVARNAVSLSRADALATALGMGIGGVCFAGIALAGLYTLLAAIGWLYAGLKIAGGLYLIYLAVRIWRGASTPLRVDAASDAAVGPMPGSVAKSFWLGLTTQLSNPKTAVVYGSVFAALLPQHLPLWGYLALPPLVFIIEAGWYSIVAVCFSSQRPRALYLRAKKAIDRLAAGAMAALGIRLLIDARKFH